MQLSGEVRFLPQNAAPGLSEGAYSTPPDTLTGFKGEGPGKRRVMGR